MEKILKTTTITGCPWDYLQEISDHIGISEEVIQWKTKWIDYISSNRSATSEIIAWLGVSKIKFVIDNGVHILMFFLMNAIVLESITSASSKKKILFCKKKKMNGFTWLLMSLIFYFQQTTLA